MIPKIKISDDPLSSYVRIGKAAKMLGVSIATLRNWDKSGKLKAYRNRMSRYRLYKIKDIEELLTSVAKIR